MVCQIFVSFEIKFLFVSTVDMLNFDMYFFIFEGLEIVGIGFQSCNSTILVFWCSTMCHWSGSNLF